MESKNEGFTLVELIATIFLVSLLLTITVGSVIGIINNSKDKSTILAENNIKKSANLFAKEYEDNIVWELDDENNMYSCISVKTLTEMGYLKKENVLSYENEYVKVVRDSDNNIYEEFDDETCQVNDKQIKIPTSQKLCNNLTYNGLEQSLINVSQIDEGYDLYINDELKVASDIKVVDAGTYKVDLILKDNYIWSDDSKEKKTIDCTVKKAIPVLELSSLGTESSTIGTTIIKFKSSIPGKAQLKSSDLNYVTASLTDDNNLVEANIEKDININVLATRDTNTYVTITLIPSDEYKNNYYTNSIVYTVGNIERIKIKKPDSTFCKNVYYNNTSQELIELKDGYKYYNYIGQDIGKYTVTAVPKYGYAWEDGTLDIITFDCEIKRPVIKVNYVGGTCTPSYKDILYEDPYGELCTPTKTGYTFNGWYYTNSYETKVKAQDKVTNLEEHNIYAKWTAKTYTVKFNANGGTGTMSPKTATYNQSFTVPSNSFKKTGYTFAGWTTKSDGTDDGYNWTGWSGTWKYDNGSYGISNNTLTLYARWTINTVTIKYRTNGGTITKTTKNSAGDKTYTWTTDSNGNIKRKINSGTSSVLTTSIKRNASLSSDGLVNYNNSNYLKITKSGYVGAANEWKCLSGCTTSGKTYDQGTAYKASDFCDTSSKSCTVVLGVNWIADKPDDLTVKLYAYNWSGTSSDCIDTKNKCDRKSVNISGYTKFKVKLKKYLDDETPPSNTSWGEVELRQGTSGSEGKGTKVIEGGKAYTDKNYESGWLNVSSYFSSSSVSLLCLAVGYTGESSCEITFTAS